LQLQNKLFLQNNHSASFSSTYDRRGARACWCCFIFHATSYEHRL